MSFRSRTSSAKANAFVEWLAGVEEEEPSNGGMRETS
jgi:hypothetical protein